MFLVSQPIGAVPYGCTARSDGTGVQRLIFTIYAPMITPPLAALTLLQRYLVQGFAHAGLKG